MTNKLLKILAMHFLLLASVSYGQEFEAEQLIYLDNGVILEIESRLSDGGSIKETIYKAKQLAPPCKPNPCYWALGTYQAEATDYLRPELVDELNRQVLSGNTHSFVRIEESLIEGMVGKSGPRREFSLGEFATSSLERISEGGHFNLQKPNLSVETTHTTRIIMEQMIEGSNFMMNLRIQHQDIKPENVFLMGGREFSPYDIMNGHQNIAHGDLDLLKSVREIVDFRNSENLVQGTHLFMSKEKLFGEFEIFMPDDPNLLPMSSLETHLIDGLTNPILREDPFSIGTTLYNLQFNTIQEGNPFIDFVEDIHSKAWNYNNMELAGLSRNPDPSSILPFIQEYLFRHSVANDQFRAWLSAKFDVAIANHGDNQYMKEDLIALRENTLNLLNVDAKKRMPRIISPTLESELWGELAHERNQRLEFRGRVRKSRIQLLESDEHWVLDAVTKIWCRANRW